MTTYRAVAPVHVEATGYGTRAISPARALGRLERVVEMAVRDWARRDARVRRRLRRVDNRRMDFMRSLFRQFCPDEDEVEARCVMAMAVFIGMHFMAADHGERSRADLLGLLRRQLLT